MKKLITIIALLFIGNNLLAQGIACPDFVCQDDPTLVTYTVPNTVGSTYVWTITGGVIVLGQGTNSVDVDWSTTAPGGPYNVTVTETTAANCVGTPVICDITVNPTPTTGVITHD